MNPYEFGSFFAACQIRAEKQAAAVPASTAYDFGTRCAEMTKTSEESWWEAFTNGYNRGVPQGRAFRESIGIDANRAAARDAMAPKPQSKITKTPPAPAPATTTATAPARPIPNVIKPPQRFTPAPAPTTAAAAPRRPVPNIIRPPQRYTPPAAAADADGALSPDALAGAAQTNQALAARSPASGIAPPPRQTVTVSPPDTHVPPLPPLNTGSPAPSALGAGAPPVSRPVR